MTYGFSLLMRGRDAGPEAFLKIAQRAEALGIDALFCSSHIVLPPQVKSGYLNIPGRKYAEHWNEGYWEPFSVCSFLAGQTRRIKLGTSIVVLPMHNPFEIAKQVAEVDRLSGGRFVFGIGVGWFEEEFELLGHDFHTRGARTDDALALMQRLWSEDPVSHDGPFYPVRDAWFSPKPLQKPHPPIWVAGHGKAALRRAARFAEAWHPVRPTLEFLGQARVDLRGFEEQAGRAPGSVKLAVKLPLVFQDGPPGAGQFPTEGRPQDIVDGVRRYRDAGAQHFLFDFVPERLTVAMDTIERFAQEVRPKL
jgi:probable F420-dependent oxidoreductase